MSGKTPMTDEALQSLLLRAIAHWHALPEEKRTAMLAEQRLSWARGEAGLRRDTAESRPDQPMDNLCELLMVDATMHSNVSTPWDWHEDTANLERKAAAEIRRLREQLQSACAGLATMADMEKVAREKGRRAGIEEAAQVAKDEVAKFSALHSIYPTQVAIAIRALADKPALDHGWKIGDIRCDACDNGVEPGWIHCAWCGAEIAARKEPDNG